MGKTDEWDEHEVIDVEKTKTDKCLNYFKQFIAFLFSHVGLCCLVVGYSILGGFIFRALEAPSEMKVKANVKVIRQEFVSKLWNITIRYNMFYRPNWTKEAEEVLLAFQDEIYTATKRDGYDGKDSEKEQQWNFAGALLYSVTVITTIGKYNTYPGGGGGGTWVFRGVHTFVIKIKKYP